MRILSMMVSRNVRATALFLLVTVAGCSDQFTDRYSTLQEARRDQVFERGWLPDVLPPSSHALKVSGDVDINTALGEFSFSRAEFEEFVARLQPVPTELASNIAERTRELENAGYVARGYVNEQYAWIFLCSKERERCEYHGWPKSY